MKFDDVFRLSLIFLCVWISSVITVTLSFSVFNVWMYVCVFQKWRSKMPLSVQWISGLSRGVSTRAALRLFVVTLCVLITLLMAILNFVSSSSASQLFCHDYCLSLSVSIINQFYAVVVFQVFIPVNNCTSITNKTELEGLRLYTGPVRIFHHVIYPCFIPIICLIIPVGK